jgi:ferredoxin-NADP reductase/ferredoxin
VEHIISLLHPKRITLKLSEVLTETSSSKTFRFAAKGGYLPPFQAGQYVNIFVDVHGIRTSRPYSISSAPTQLGYYDITIRNVEDGFVSGFFLDEVTVGSEFEATSPSGNFIYNPLFHGKDLVFLAGGSGVTPFMSMIREVADRGLSRRIHLIYGSRNPDDVIFSSELRAITEKHTNISCSLVISNPPKGYRGLTGFITAELMKKILGDVSRRKIRTEVYGPPKDVTTQPGWPRDVKPADVFTVKIKGDKAIPAKASEPLMISLERNGVVIPALCRSGECSLCRTKLLSGRVFQPEGVKLRKSDRHFGYNHPCMAYPLTDLEILL